MTRVGLSPFTGPSLINPIHMATAASSPASAMATSGLGNPSAGLVAVKESLRGLGTLALVQRGGDNTDLSGGGMLGAVLQTGNVGCSSVEDTSIKQEGTK